MIELLALPTMDPVPRVRVRVTGAPSGAATLTVWRESRSGTAPVRAAVEATASDPFTAVDYTVPWNEDVVYWADFFGASGARIASTDREATRVVFFGTVLHQPLDPSRAVAVEMMSASARSVTARFPGEHLQPGGAMLPVWVGQGGGSVDTNLRMRLRSERDRGRAQSMFGTRAEPLPPILCLRTSVPIAQHLPQPYVFLAVDVPWEAWDHFAGGEQSMLDWQVSETTEPALGLVVSPYSYEDLETYFATYADLEADASHDTYEDIEERNDLAGVA